MIGHGAIVAEALGKINQRTNWRRNRLLRIANGRIPDGYANAVEDFPEGAATPLRKHRIASPFLVLSPSFRTFATISPTFLRSCFLTTAQLRLVAEVWGNFAANLVRFRLGLGYAMLLSPEIVRRFSTACAVLQATTACPGWRPLTPFAQADWIVLPVPPPDVTQNKFLRLASSKACNLRSGQLGTQFALPLDPNWQLLFLWADVHVPGF
jgi:hypothetical protein